MAETTPAAYSFEMYPPRTPAIASRLPEIVGALAAARPRFISVTYGAAGTTRDASRAVLARIRAAGVEPMAHLTCVRSTYTAAHALVRRFLDDGITNFLAVRGDPPEDGEGDGLGEIRSAAELVQLIDRVHAERVPYDEVPVPGVPGAAEVEHRREQVRIAVAAFLNGHPASRGIAQDIDTLLAKQAAGATMALTQLFFHAGDYFRFVERARRAGVTMPIVPGVMPVTSPARLARMLELSGEHSPDELALALEREPTVEGQRAIGVAHAAALIRTLLRGGAPGVHLYTFNHHRTALEVIDAAGLTSSDPSSTSTPEPVSWPAPRSAQKGQQ